MPNNTHAKLQSRGIWWAAHQCELVSAYMTKSSNARVVIWGCHSCIVPTMHGGIYGLLSCGWWMPTMKLQTHFYVGFHTGIYPTPYLKCNDVLISFKSEVSTSNWLLSPGFLYFSPFFVPFEPYQLMEIYNLLNAMPAFGASLTSLEVQSMELSPLFCPK